MSERDEAIAQFVGAADCQEATARFFLESANWDLEVSLVQCAPGWRTPQRTLANGNQTALNQYLESRDGQADSDMGSGDDDDDDADDVPTGSAEPLPKSQTPGGRPKSRGGGPMTLRDLQNAGSDDEEANDDPNLFTGGEKS